MSTAEVPPRGATDALVERLNAATLGTLELASVHVGNRLGFYRSLAEGGDATPGELAARTGTAERYVREWLEQQAVAGLLTAHDPDAPAEARCYGLPAAHRPVLVEGESLSHLAPLATLAIGVLGPMDALLDAYRKGGGVPYEAYGADTREGIAAINRPAFVRDRRGDPHRHGPRLRHAGRLRAGGGAPDRTRLMATIAFALTAPQGS